MIPNGGIVGLSPSGNTYSVTLTPGQSTVTGKDFGTYQIVTDGNASVVGQVFTDFNDNGIQDPGDTGVANAVVYLDDQRHPHPGDNRRARQRYSVP